LRSLGTGLGESRVIIITGYIQNGLGGYMTSYLQNRTCGYMTGYLQYRPVGI